VDLGEAGAHMSSCICSGCFLLWSHSGPHLEFYLPPPATSFPPTGSEILEENLQSGYQTSTFQELPPSLRVKNFSRPGPAVLGGELLLPMSPLLSVREPLLLPISPDSQNAGTFHSCLSLSSQQALGTSPHAALVLCLNKEQLSASSLTCHNRVHNHKCPLHLWPFLCCPALC
jgi:hypothetical protein